MPREHPYWYRAKKVGRFIGGTAAHLAAGDAGVLAYNALVPEVADTQMRDRVYGQGTFTTEVHKGGRRLRRKTTRYARKLVRSIVNHRVYGVDNYTLWFGQNYGKWKLLNYFDTRVGEGYYLPCHLWDVTCVPNTYLGTKYDPQCGYRCCLTDGSAGANMLWRALGDPLTSRNQNRPGTSIEGTPLNSSLLTGVKAKILFYCPTKIPVRVKVSLIQLSDQKYHPPKIFSAGGQEMIGDALADNVPIVAASAGGDYVNAAALWMNVNKPFTSNPVYVGDGNIKGIKYIKSMQCTLTPKETSDNTATTYHLVNFYHRFNRMQRYNWEDHANANPSDTSFSLVRGQNKCCVHPNARYYIMIQADSQYFSGAAEPPLDVEKTPTYDICLRTYHDDV